MQTAPVLLLSPWVGELVGAGRRGLIKHYMGAESVGRGLLHASSVSPPEAAATTALRSSVSISIHAAARSVQHHNWADGGRTADVSWMRRDLAARHFWLWSLENGCLKAVAFSNTSILTSSRQMGCQVTCVLLKQSASIEAFCLFHCRLWREFDASAFSIPPPRHN